MELTVAPNRRPPVGHPAAAEQHARSLFTDTVLRAAFGPDDSASSEWQRLSAWVGAIAANSRRAIASDLRIVAAFQDKRNQPVLPVTPSAMFTLLDELANAGKAKSTINRLVASMVRLHAVLELPPPVDDLVRWKQRSIRVSDKRVVRQARGLRLKGDVADLADETVQPASLLALLDSIPDDTAGKRDRALLSVGYDAGLRRSELVAIRIEHIKRLGGGDASLFIPHSKTDQEADGAYVWLSRTSATHLADWTSHAGISDGFVFRSLAYTCTVTGHLSAEAVGRILKQRLRAHLSALVIAGELDAAEIEPLVAATSAHSLRVGCDQDLFAAGVDLGAIMLGLRWSDAKQPLAYARHLAPQTSKVASTMRQYR